MKCIVGMSGGVDSSVSAALMLDRGFEVIGCTLKMFESDKIDASILDAKKVASHFNINHLVIDCCGDFQNYVMNYFINSYKNGCTPNPCVMCNASVKFNWLEKFRIEQNADLIVTGHYANIAIDHDLIQLKQADYLEKDQSYFLYRVGRDILRHVEFPLGSIKKSDARKLADKYGLHVASKEDSQDVCFIPPDGNYISFIKEKLPEIASCGSITDKLGNKLGIHDGIINYTIGQRKRLGLAGGPYFVCDINTATNSVVVTNKDGIRSKKIFLKEVTFINEEYSGHCEIKIRSANKKIRAQLAKKTSQYEVELFEYEYGIAEGQHCVFYQNSTIIGGGIIEKQIS